MGDGPAEEGGEGPQMPGEGSGFYPLDGVGRVPTLTVIRADSYKFGLFYI